MFISMYLIGSQSCLRIFNFLNISILVFLLFIAIRISKGNTIYPRSLDDSLPLRRIVEQVYFCTKSVLTHRTALSVFTYRCMLEELKYCRHSLPPGDHLQGYHSVCGRQIAQYEGLLYKHYLDVVIFKSKDEIIVWNFVKFYITPDYGNVCKYRKLTLGNDEQNMGSGNNNYAYTYCGRRLPWKLLTNWRKTRLKMKVFRRYGVMNFSIFYVKYPVKSSTSVIINLVNFLKEYMHISSRLPYLTQYRYVDFHIVTITPVMYKQVLTFGEITGAETTISLHDGPGKKCPVIYNGLIKAGVYYYLTAHISYLSTHGMKLGSSTFIIKYAFINYDQYQTDKFTYGRKYGLHANSNNNFLIYSHVFMSPSGQDRGVRVTDYKFTGPTHLAGTVTVCHYGGIYLARSSDNSIFSMCDEDANADHTLYFEENGYFAVSIVFFSGYSNGYFVLELFTFSCKPHLLHSVIHATYTFDILVDKCVSFAFQNVKQHIRSRQTLIITNTIGPVEIQFNKTKTADGCYGDVGTQINSIMLPDWPNNLHAKTIRQKHVYNVSFTKYHGFVKRLSFVHYPCSGYLTITLKQVLCWEDQISFLLKWRKIEPLCGSGSLPANTNIDLVYLPRDKHLQNEREFHVTGQLQYNEKCHTLCRNHSYVLWSYCENNRRWCEVKRNVRSSGPNPLSGVWGKHMFHLRILPIGKLCSHTCDIEFVIIHVDLRKWRNSQTAAERRRNPIVLQNSK